MIKVHPAFDSLLGGGLSPGVLTHIYGPPSSGKTNFALMATVSATREGTVVYVDSEGGFNTERLKQLSQDRFNEVLSKTIHFTPDSFDDQKIKLHEAEAIAAEGDVRLLVLDSLALLYRLLEEKDSKSLGRTLAKLLHIAVKHNVCVLMLNQVYTDIDSGEIKPVGGGLHDYWSKVMLEAGVTDDGTRWMILKKHPTKTSKEHIHYEITNDGIQLIKKSSP